MNIQPEVVYTALQKCQMFDPQKDMFGIFINFRLNARFEKAYLKLCEKLYFNKYPRRRKFSMSKVDDELLVMAKQEIERRAKAFILARVKQIELLKNILASIELPEPSDEKHLIKSASSMDYRSQGFGAVKYAKGSLLPDKLILESAGYETEIVEFKTNHDTNFKLFANCPKWAYESLLLGNSTVEMKEIAQHLWRNNVNPRVYFPFLPKQDYEYNLGD